MTNDMTDTPEVMSVRQHVDKLAKEHAVRRVNDRNERIANLAAEYVDAKTKAEDAHDKWEEQLRVAYELFECLRNTQQQ